MSTHPSDVMDAFSTAWRKLHALADEADKRGDTVGKEAWMEAVVGLEALERMASVARSKQNFDRCHACKRVDKTCGNCKPRDVSVTSVKCGVCNGNGSIRQVDVGGGKWDEVCPQCAGRCYVEAIL